MKYWDNTTDANKFNTLFKELETDVLKNNHYDLEKWQLAAEYIVPLARGKAAGEFTFPRDAPKVLYGKLPGYHKGMSQSIKKIPRVTHQNVQFHNRNIPLFDYMKICVYMMKKDKIGVWCVCGMCFFPGTRKGLYT